MRIVDCPTMERSVKMNVNSRKLAFASILSIVALSGAGLSLAQPSDELTEARLESRIMTTYSLNRHLNAKDLNVLVDDRVATLTGTVTEDIHKELAEQIALGVDGIDDVDNQIEVNPEYISSTPSGERTYSEVVEDAAITAAVKSKLVWSKHAQGLSVNVDSASGKVTLSGTAKSSEAKEMAGLLATNTHGVKSVDNKLTIEEDDKTIIEDAKDEAAGLGQRLSDTWITAKVKSTLMYSSNVDSSNISVSTEEGVVTLTGNVASDTERALAVEIVKNVRGVTRVEAEALTHP